MKKEFSLSNGKAMINFTAKYCNTEECLLDSKGFEIILSEYLEDRKSNKSNIYKYINKSLNQDEICLELIKIFKFLIVLKADEIIKIDLRYKKLLEDKDKFIGFVEDLYNFWRKLERYTIVENKKTGEGLQNVNFIDANNEFSKLILDVYRKVEENVLGVKPSIYRQLPAGGNAGLILNQTNFVYGKGYECLCKIPFIQSIVLDTPFITYPKKNTRDGIFNESFENPLKDCSINTDHWFCYPAKVGTLLAYIYFHRDFMAHGVTLCNLFEMAKEEEYKDKKPDIIYVFGAKDEEKQMKTVFYDDVENDIMTGYINYHDDMDYFGYMKKMTLTLHNLIMIKRGNLPVHGAMVNIITKDDKTFNIVIMGDSGAGKSESLEALRSLGSEYISDMTIIFDDMGVVKLNGEGKPLGYGTEIGAFVRLDDLDTGYAFKQLDRSIFMNPDKINARLVMPVASYNEITKGEAIDLFLYANNYEDGEALEFFTNEEEAIKVFKEGTRMAKGTTTEKGLVTSYFSNPFGPVQKQQEMDELIPIFFKEFFNKGIRVGQLRTKLGMHGNEKRGPREASLRLLEEIKSL
ncbi:phosphoenolpyruvate carboxykinase [Clostridium algidicarnis]|uniref:phosphoenolpyruvate carboxykinase n=1 Tax=Clostridium algidicarnis TaxID=37659 RepID=UPI001CF52089|nr:phosphoenolpyruvate carboxykinase [Clostridium algidicarnis]MCB2286594.1 phosphoenolpyruvate carboxykinase [Clostridium algidicarnis]